MSGKVRVGVVGTSEWADFMYLSSLCDYPSAKLISICGRDQGRANEIAAKYNIPQVFSDYNDMINQAINDRDLGQ